MLATKVTSLNSLAPSSIQFSHKTLTFILSFTLKCLLVKKTIFIFIPTKNQSNYQKCSLLKNTVFELIKTQSGFQKCSELISSPKPVTQGRFSLLSQTYAKELVHSTTKDEHGSNWLVALEVDCGKMGYHYPQIKDPLMTEIRELSYGEYWPST